MAALTKLQKAKRMTTRKWNIIRKAVLDGCGFGVFKDMVQDIERCGFCREYYEGSASVGMSGCWDCPLVEYFKDSNIYQGCIPFQPKWMNQKRMLKYCDDVLAAIKAVQDG